MGGSFRGVPVARRSWFAILSVAALAAPADAITPEEFERDLDALSKTAIRTIGKTKRDELVAKWTGTLKWIQDNYPSESKERTEWIRRVKRSAPALGRLSAAALLDNSTGDDVKKGSTTEPIVASLRNIDPSRAAEKEYSKALTTQLLPSETPSRKDSCKAICDTFEQLPKWGFDGSRVSMEWADNDKISSNGDWGFAMHAMEALFAVEAAPLCTEVKDAGKTLKNVLDRWVKTNKLVDKSISLSGKYGPYGLHFSTLLLARLPEASKESRIVRDAIPESLADEKAAEMLKQTRERLGRGVDQFARLESGLGGSGLEMHSLSVMLSSLRDRGADVAKKVGDAYAEGKYEDCHVPYHVQKMVAGNKFVGLNEREGAARCMAYWFGQTMANGDNAANRKQLLMALENYVAHAGSLVANVPRSGAHSGVDQMAPYYYAPTTLVATAAAQLLANGDDEKTRERVDKMKDWATRATLASYRGEGKWITPASKTLSDANFTEDDRKTLFGRGALSFGTALPALSLVPACRADGSIGAYQGVYPQKTKAPKDDKLAEGPKGDDKDKHKGPEELPMPHETPREEDRRPRAEALAALLKNDFPKDKKDISAYVEKLRDRDLVPELGHIVGGGKTKSAFFKGLGVDESSSIAEEFQTKLEFEVAALEQLRNHPKSPLNAPWMKILTGSSRPDAAKAEDAVKTLTQLRQWAGVKDTKEQAKAHAWAAEFAKKLSSDARESMAKELKSFTPPTDSRIPPAYRKLETFLSKILKHALEFDDGGTGTLPVARR